MIYEKKELFKMELLDHLTMWKQITDVQTNL